ncbi:MAG: HEAT repeat domain-containing protein [Verrucomicrobiota bacterium]|nr:HEAT repeat domain-containing protein [Verrucomicrobiota bacterium]
MKRTTPNGEGSHFSHRRAVSSRKWLFCVMTGLGVVFCITWFWPRPVEPVHEGRTFSEWQAEAQSPDPTIRSNAWRAIEQMGPAALPYLEARLGSPNLIAHELRSKARGWVPELVRRKIRPWIPKESNDQQRLQAIQGMKMLGTNASEALPILSKAIYDPSPMVSLGAFNALGDLGGVAVPVLREALKRDDPRIRMSAASALGQMGTNAAEAIPELIELLQTSGPLGANVAYSLAKMSPLSIEPLAVAALHTNSNSSQMALLGLRHVGKAASNHLGVVIAKAGDTNPYVRAIALEAIGIIGNGGPYGEIFERALRDTNEVVVDAALQSLTRVELKSSIAPLLADLLRHEREHVRLFALLGLNKLGKAAAPYELQIQALQHDHNWSVRNSATQALEKIRSSRP